MGKRWIILITIILLSIIIWFISGCATLNPGEIPDTPQEVLYRTVLKTNWLATAAIIGIAASAFAFLNGNKVGIAGMVACFIALSITLAVARFAIWIALVGTIGSIGLLFYSFFVKDKALKEIVNGVEVVKHQIKINPYIDNITATPMIKSILSGQSPTTKKLVKKIKEE